MHVAEGFGRGGTKEFTPFLSISYASCLELKSQQYRLEDRPYFDQDLNEAQSDLESLKTRINGFMIYLKKSDLKGYKFREDESHYEAPRSTDS